MTDASGHYFLKNLPTGTITVEARMMSYDPVRHEVTLKKGQSLELNFEITENGITMDDVVSRPAAAKPRVAKPRLGERPRPQNFRQHQFGLSGPGTRVPARRTRRGRLPELRFHAGAHQRLDGHYSQILVDSHPVFSALSAFMDWSRFRPA